MSKQPPAYTPINLEKFFELLDTRLVSLGLPTALLAVGVNEIRIDGDWPSAIKCFGGAAAVFAVIKVGKALSPKLNTYLTKGIDWLERSLLKGISAARSDFTGKYLQRQTELCEEFISEGFNPEHTAIPLLEEVFVPLDLRGALSSGILTNRSNRQDLVRLQQEAELMSADLNIWKLLARSRKDRKFRRMVILAKGGMGKTTLTRHIALIYGQRKRLYGAPRLVPVLLRLRAWVDELTQLKPPSLPKLIAEHHLPSLSENHPLTAPDGWADKLLQNGKALVMFDGFDEIPPGKRPQVSRWISAQMGEYRETVFILTSRPVGYEDYTAQRPAIPIYINKFNSAQQEDFIRKWYLCQESSSRSKKRKRKAKEIAREKSKNLIRQLQARRDELGYMAENPLLLNMLVTFHRYDPAAELPRQRLGLYQGICKLQLEDRPKARLIRMLLPYRKSVALLQSLALGMVKTEKLTVSRSGLLNFLSKQAVLKDEEVEPADWLKQIEEISELLVQREPGEYEFPHASFQGFFAASLLAKPEDKASKQANARLILQNWAGAIWRETILLYVAQLPPKLLSQVITAACQQSSKAAELADACLKEYPRPEKLGEAVMATIENLRTIAVDSKYQQLNSLLKAGEWEAADKETYRLMITTVGKEEGQWFDEAEVFFFPCEDLKTIDRLWVESSGGKFGFSVQKKIYVDCGVSQTDLEAGNYPGDKIWNEFCDRVGRRRKKGHYLNYSNLKKDPHFSPSGELPAVPREVRSFLFGRVLVVEMIDCSLFSRIGSCKL